MGNHFVIHLIRHEKTIANLNRKYIGWTDEPIFTSNRPFKLPIEAEIIYGSDLKRCEQTAQLYFPGVTYCPEKNLRELNFGDFEMKTYEDLKDNLNYRNWIDDPQLNTPPNGEPYAEFAKRVLTCFQQIISQNDEYTFIVHGGVIRFLLTVFGPMEKSFQQINVSHRTVYSLQWENISDVKEGKRCRLLSVEPIMAKEGL